MFIDCCIVHQRSVTQIQKLINDLQLIGSSPRHMPQYTVRCRLLLFFNFKNAIQNQLNKLCVNYLGRLFNESKNN